MTEASKEVTTYKKFYEKHKEDLNKKIVCGICNGNYSKNTKYNHFHSKKHIICEKDKKLCEKDKKLQELENKINFINEQLNMN
jgi:hypothetical protein